MLFYVTWCSFFVMVVCLCLYCIVCLFELSVLHYNAYIFARCRSEARWCASWNLTYRRCRQHVFATHLKFVSCIVFSWPRLVQLQWGWHARVIGQTMRWSSDVQCHFCCCNRTDAAIPWQVVVIAADIERDLLKPLPCANLRLWIIVAHSSKCSSFRFLGLSQKSRMTLYKREYRLM